jgi:hypothetical protein
VSGFGALGARPTPSRTWAGVHRGSVTRVDAGGRPFVELPRLAPGHEYGPLEYVETPTPWEVGDRVLLAFVEGRGDTPVVLGRLV